MSDLNTALDDDETTDETGDQPGWRKRLESKAKRADEAEAAAALATKENAFLRAGIDPASDEAQYFFKGYDGELTPEAITAAAVKAKLIEAPKAPEDASATASATPNPDDPDQRGHDSPTTDVRRDVLGGDASPPIDTTKPPLESAKDAYDEVLARGGRREDAAAAAFSDRMRRAQEGDLRVLVSESS